MSSCLLLIPLLTNELRLKRANLNWKILAAVEQDELKSDDNWKTTEGVADMLKEYENAMCRWQIAGLNLYIENEQSWIEITNIAWVQICRVPRNTEWIQMDWKLRIIDKRQEWRSGQSLTFFSLVDLHIVLYCINALYFRHSLWWLCTRQFLHFVFYLIFCILWTVLYLCIVHCSFSVMTLQKVFRALCIYIFCSQFFSHILYLYFCIVYLIFLRWVCTSYFIYWTLYFVFFTLLHSVFVQCALHISAFSAVSLRIKIDLLPRPSLSSQAAHHNLRAKTSFIKIQIRRISSKYKYRIYMNRNIQNIEIDGSLKSDHWSKKWI